MDCNLPEAEPAVDEESRRARRVKADSEIVGSSREGRSIHASIEACGSTTDQDAIIHGHASRKPTAPTSDSIGAVVAAPAAVSESCTEPEPVSTQTGPSGCDRRHDFSLLTRRRWRACGGRRACRRKLARCGYGRRLLCGRERGRVYRDLARLYLDKSPLHVTSSHTVLRVLELNVEPFAFVTNYHQGRSHSGDAKRDAPGVWQEHERGFLNHARASFIAVGHPPVPASEAQVGQSRPISSASLSISEQAPFPLHAWKIEGKARRSKGESVCRRRHSP